MRAVFLDRDGVLNRGAEPGEYILSWDEFEILPDAVEAVKMFNGLGLKVVVVTNQSPIGRGFFTHEALADIHKRMLDEFYEGGALIDAIYYCPHAPDAGCGCRKPEPGMILNAARDLGIELEKSWMIGDAESDIEAGRRAGCKTILVEKNVVLLEAARQVADELAQQK